MTPERWQQVKALLNSALELDPQQRPGFVAEACCGDSALRQEVEGLIAYHDRSTDFFDAPVMEFAAEALGADPNSLAGKTVGPYTILSHLGAGAMGEVYLSRDARLDRHVALKFLPLEFTTDAERLRRFRQEASTASRLNHPGILTIYEVGQDGASHYIASEFVDGRTLRDLMAETPMRIIDAVDAAWQAASALSAAHAAGIVHRDVKPENLMLRSDGVLKVLDFGLAKLIEQSGDPVHARTDPGTVMGTVAYMSPEQARGQTVDARTDVWSLGVVLYELIAGRVPFGGTSRADVLVSILEREPAPLAERAEAIPAELDRVVRTALAKDLRRRYATIDELARDLKAIKQELEFVDALKRRSGGDAPAGGEFHRDLTAPEPARRASNLSTELRSIVGRDAELDAIESLLRDDQVRLVTLTGPGGTGKTRLAQQVARSLLSRFNDGVFFVALAPLNDHRRRSHRRSESSIERAIVRHRIAAVPERQADPDRARQLRALTAGRAGGERAAGGVPRSTDPRDKPGGAAPWRGTRVCRSAARATVP